MIRNIGIQCSVRKTIIWLLAIVLVLYLVSGFGITRFRIVEAATFGLLTRDLSFKIHNNLLIPFVILLILHLCLPLIFNREMKRSQRKEE
jgi:cytochrome b subunit of formate dehydrogenase